MSLYNLKVMIFLGEVMSVIFTPFVLWVSLSNRSERIIDFFREFTVHVDGIGYVCSFAVFDFQKPGVCCISPIIVGSQLMDAGLLATKYGRLT